VNIVTLVFVTRGLEENLMILLCWNHELYLINRLKNTTIDPGQVFPREKSGRPHVAHNQLTGEYWLSIENLYPPTQSSIFVSMLIKCVTTSIYYLDLFASFLTLSSLSSPLSLLGYIKWIYSPYHEKRIMESLSPRISISTCVDPNAQHDSDEMTKNFLISLH